jgi:hypothetical protein
LITVRFSGAMAIEPVGLACCSRGHRALRGGRARQQRERNAGSEKMLHLILLKVVDAASARWAQENTLPQRRRSAAPETEKAKINLAVDT